MHRMCFVPARMSNLHFLPVQHSNIFTPGTDDEVMHYNEVNLLNHCSLSRLALTSSTYPRPPPPHPLNHLIENLAIPHSTNAEGPQNTNNCCSSHPRNHTRMPDRTAQLP